MVQVSRGGAARSARLAHNQEVARSGLVVGGLSRVLLLEFYVTAFGRLLGAGFSRAGRHRGSPRSTFKLKDQRHGLPVGAPCRPRRRQDAPSLHTPLPARIQDSVYTELKWAIAHLGLEAAYDVQKTTIIHRRTGAEFIFYGIERNLGCPACCVGDADARSILQKYSF